MCMDWGRPGGGGVSSTNSLPPGYLSSLQGSKRSASPSDSSRPLSPSSSVVQEKLTQMQTVSYEFGDGLEKHQETLKEQEGELEQLKERFATIEERLREASSKSSETDHLDPKASVKGIELRPDQVQTIAILQKQNETLQDQVICRDLCVILVHTSSPFSHAQLNSGTDWHKIYKGCGSLTSFKRNLSNSIKS